MAELIAMRLIDEKFQSIGIRLDSNQIKCLLDTSNSELPITFFRDEQLSHCSIHTNELKNIHQLFIKDIASNNFEKIVKDKKKELSSNPENLINEFTKVMFPVMKSDAEAVTIVHPIFLKFSVVMGVFFHLPLDLEQLGFQLINGVGCAGLMFLQGFNRVLVGPIGRFLLQIIKILVQVEHPVIDRPQTQFQ